MCCGCREFCDGAEPVFHGDLVYKFKRVVWKPKFSALFRKIKCDITGISCDSPFADPVGGGGEQGVRTPLKNHKNIGFLCNTGPDPLKNHKADKPAFNVGPSSARQRNAISMEFRWRADDGPIKAVFPIN